MKYKINAEELPEEIEAKNLEEAEKFVLDNIAIQEDDTCSCGGCEVCVQGEEAFNKANDVN